MTDNDNLLPPWLIVLLIHGSSKFWCDPHRLKELARHACPAQSIGPPLTCNIESPRAKEGQTYKRVILFL